MKVVNEIAAGAKRRQRRRAKCLAAAVASVPLLVLPAIGTAAAADAPVFDALPPGPTRALTLSLIAGGNDDDLRGVVCEAPRTCMAVPYPYLDREAGVVELDNALRNDAPDHQIIYGYSQGANVAGDWLKQYVGAEGAVPPSALSFVLIGNPGRKHGGSRVRLDEMTPDTEYNVLDVSRQYDLSSDTPDDTGNLLAMINAYAGFSSVHPDYEDVDIYDPANYVWKEGNTTYVFVPTERLPILAFLYNLGLTQWADSLDAVLRPAIEKAYDRSYLPAQPGFPPAEPAAEEEAVEPERPEVVALSVARSAPTEDENHTANLVQEDTDSQSRSETADMDFAAGFEVAAADFEVADVDLADVDLEEADLEDAGLEDADLEDDTLISEAAEDQGAVAASFASEDGDSPQSSSDEDSSSSDSDSSPGGGSSSGSEGSSDNGE